MPPERTDIAWQAILTKQAFAIAAWGDQYENESSRKIKRPTWVAVPNRHDGKGFGRIAVQDDATDIFTAWNLVLQMASRSPIRGILADDDGPIDFDDMAIKTRFPKRIFERALPFLMSAKIAWITLVDWPVDPDLVQIYPRGVRIFAGIPGQDPDERPKNPVEQNRKEQNRKEVVDGDDDGPEGPNPEFGKYPLPEETYQKHPVLRMLHHDTIYLRGLTLEQYLFAVKNRSPYMDFTAAAQEVIRRAELDGNIRKPGIFVDRQFGYWERDHVREIGIRKDAHARAKREDDDLVAFLVEVGGPDDERGTRQLDHFTKGQPKRRAAIVARYEKAALAGKAES